MPAAGVVMIVAVVLIVAAVVVYLLGTIMALRKITAGLDAAIAGVVGIIEKSAPVEEVVNDINQNLDAGVDLLEGLLVKKAGLQDAVGLIDGLYPGAASAGLRNFPDSTKVRAPRISEVYTKGTLTLARLGREAPIAAASPKGPALRNPVVREPGGAGPVPRRAPDPARADAALAGDRRRLAGAVRPRRRGGGTAQADARPPRKELTTCRHRHRFSTSAPPASKGRSPRFSGWAPMPA